MFALLKRQNRKAKAADKLYQAIMACTRQPDFYTYYGVPDTLDGRFDLLCLHGFLVMDRLLEGGREGQVLSQALFDRMFRDMDQILREIGIGDLSLPRHVKRMMTGFHGRATTYRDALAVDDEKTLVQALLKNLYGSAEHKPSAEILSAMACYMRGMTAHLAAQDLATLAAGKVDFEGYEHDGRDRHDTDNPAGMVA